MLWLWLACCCWSDDVAVGHVFESCMPLKAVSADMDMEQLVGRVARCLEGKPYKEGTLEGAGPESLIIHLEGFDCFTLMETVMAAARSLKHKESFESALRQLRYRNGRIDGYASRLHYTVDWAWDNSQKGLIQDVTREIGGVERRKAIHFMSNHRSAYKGLVRESEFQSILEIEKAINQRQHYYLPKDRVALNEHLIQEGDLIACTTSIDGLDVSHVGVAVRLGERVHLLHASKKAGRVIISKKPLGDYVASQPKQDGIMVFRPLD